MRSLYIDDALTESAVDWIVLLTSGQASDRDRQRFEHWLSSHPNNARAWAEVDGLMQQPLSRLRTASQETPGPARAARTALLQTSSLNRRRVLKLALLMAGVGVGALVADRYVPLAGLSATYATRTGERRTYALSDGSLLTLNARSVADVRYDDGQRTVVLHQGGMYAQAHADARPFVVCTCHGEVSTAAGHLSISQFDRYSVAGALQGRLTVQPKHGNAMTLAQGGSASFDTDHAWMREGEAQDGWRNGMLSVRDTRLAEVVDQLRAYQAGLIRVSPEVAELRVFGVFRLDDPGRALDALGDTLPIRVRRYGPWLTLVESV